VRDVIVASDELIASAGYLADRISVNLEQENKIFEGQGVEAYEAYQVAHENENLQKRKGVYPLMKHFSLVGSARQKCSQQEWIQ
jgi:predicted DNA-binding helix-hairpin-helix protein